MLEPTCTRGGWNVSCTTGDHIDGAILHVFKIRRERPWLCQYGEANDKQFSSSDEAFSYALQRGYLQPYYKRAWLYGPRESRSFSLSSVKVEQARLARRS